MNARVRLGVAVLALVLGWLAWLGWERPEVGTVAAPSTELRRARATAPAPVTTAVTTAASHSERLRLDPRPDPHTRVRDLFARPAPPAPARPPAPAVAAAPVQPASAPRLPYTYLGRLEVDGAVQVFLMEGDQALIATVGKPVSRGWRLLAADARQLRFKYEPMDAELILNTGAER